jgi:quercetin dioxygenase-like cupin family protein
VFNPVVDIATLPQLVPGRPMLEGAKFGLDHLTVVLGVSPPGQRIRRHRHDYEEIFIIHEGTGTYWIRNETFEVGPEQIVLIPSGAPHGFGNLTDQPLIHTAIHSSGTFVVEWLE